MVVVAIISIMSGTVVLGFNSFGQTVRVRETAGVITDLIKNMELGMIRRDYKKQTIHFAPDYLVTEAEAEEQDPDLLLSWNGPSGTCGNAEELAIQNNSLSVVYLAKRDNHENNMEINPISPGAVTECINFKNSEEPEWQYQLFSGSKKSQTIRFLHFNIRRDDQSNLPAIEQGPPTYTLEISAPYAGETFYKNGTPTTAPVVLTLKKEDSSETITLQK